MVVVVAGVAAVVLILAVAAINFAARRDVRQLREREAEHRREMERLRRWCE